MSGGWHKPPFRAGLGRGTPLLSELVVRDDPAGDMHS